MGRVKARSDIEGVVPPLQSPSRDTERLDDDVKRVAVAVVNKDLKNRAIEGKKS